MGKLLGKHGEQKLLQIATQSSPITQTVLFLDWAKIREGIAPKIEEDSGFKEQQIQNASLSDGPRYIEPGLMIDATMALTTNDIEGFTMILQSLVANHGSVAPIQLIEAIVDRIGEDARPFLQDLALNSSDTMVREVAAHGLMYSTEGHTNPPAQPSANTPSGFGFGAGQGSRLKLETSIDLANLSSLESILNTPGIIPSTLAANIGFTPIVHAQLLKYIVSK